MFLSSTMLIYYPNCSFEISLILYWFPFLSVLFPSPPGRRSPVNPNQTVQQDSAARAALGPRQSLRPHHWRGPAGKHSQSSPRLLWCRFRWERGKAGEKSSCQCGLLWTWGHTSWFVLWELDLSVQKCLSFSLYLNQSQSKLFVVERLLPIEFPPLVVFGIGFLRRLAKRNQPYQQS